MIRMYGRTTFLPGWALMDLDAIVHRAATDKDPLVCLRREAVADLLESLATSGVGSTTDLDGWAVDTIRSQVDHAEEKGRLILELPVPAMRALIERVRGIEMCNAAATSLG